MKKSYSGKWQHYFIRLLENVPLIIPRETNKEKSDRQVNQARVVLAGMMAMSANTMYYKI